MRTQIQSFNTMDNLLNQMNDDVLVDQRIIFLETGVDLTTTSFLQQRIHLITAVSCDVKSPITIELSSYGGDAYALFAIIDVINSAPMKINIHGRGAIMSAGAYILIAATGERSMTPNSTLMVHSVQSMAAGDIESVKNQVKHTDFLNDKVIQLLVTASHKSSIYWKKQLKDDCYLTAEECKKLGLIDVIR
jgi:ATP-dependent Clp protease, protease subunit